MTDEIKRFAWVATATIALVAAVLSWTLPNVALAHDSPEYRKIGGHYHSDLVYAVRIPGTRDVQVFSPAPVASQRPIVKGKHFCLRPKNMMCGGYRTYGATTERKWGVGLSYLRYTFRNVQGDIANMQAEVWTDKGWGRKGKIKAPHYIANDLVRQ